MYRKLASVVLVASALQVNLLFALGLGEMTMHSALNEPLDAEIQLNSVAGLDETQIKIALGSHKQFENAGIDRTFFLSNVKFSVVMSDHNSGVIKLSSNRRLNEPFLDFLLEAKWPTGRVLRSYTALVDLPVYDEVTTESVSLGSDGVQPDVPQATSAPVVPSVNSAPTQVASGNEVQPQVAAPTEQESSSTAVAEVSSPVVAQTTGSAEPEPTYQAPEPAYQEVEPSVVSEPTSQESSYQVESAASESVSYSDDVYNVQRNDTLWEIAQEVRPASNMSVQQVMLALQRYNENAFIGGNINRLKSDVELTIPTAEMIREVSARQAIGEVRGQNQQWKAQLDATPVSSSSYAKYESADEGHLSLSSAGAGAANGSEETGKLRNRLNAAQDELVSSERENDALNGKVGSLNTQVDKLERLLELKNTELAELQQQLGEEAAESEEAKALEKAIEQEKAEVEAVEAEAEAVKAEQQESVEVDESEQTVAATSTPDESQNAADESKPEEASVSEAEEQESFLDKALANPMYLGGVAIFIVALVAFVLLRRKSKAEQKAFEEFEHFEFEAEDESVEPAVDSVDVVDTEEESAAEEVSEVASEVELEEENLDLDADAAEVLEEAEMHTTVQTGDAIGEAEIYIAYGRFEQAADLLKGAIDASPNDVELRSKLVEVYIESQNKDGFQEHFVELQSMGAGDAVTHVKELLTSHDGVADWLDDLPSPAPSQAVEESIDLDIPDMDEDEVQDVTVIRDGVSLRGFDEEESEQSLDADTVDLDVDLEDSGEELDTSIDIGDLDLGDDSDISLDLDLDLESGVEETDEEEINLDLSSDLDASVEAELDDLSLDLSSIELDDDLSSSESGSSADSSLDLGDLDLGLDESVELEVDGDLSDLDLSLGDEIDLSVDIESVSGEESEGEIDLSELELGESIEESLGDLDLSEDVELDLDVESISAADETLAAVDELEEAVDGSLDTSVEEPASEEAVVQGSGDVDDSPLATLEGEDLEFLSDADEISTKLDLARAYVEMGDIDGAKDILDEVLSEGNEAQKGEANEMLKGLE